VIYDFEDFAFMYDLENEFFEAKFKGKEPFTPKEESDLLAQAVLGGKLVSKEEYKKY
jgi:hypothetical protein